MNWIQCLSNAIQYIEKMYSEEGHFGKFLKGYGEIDEKEFLLHKVHTLLWVRIESEDEIRKAYEQELLKTIKTNY